MLCQYEAFLCSPGVDLEEAVCHVCLADLLFTLRGCNDVGCELLTTAEARDHISYSDSLFSHPQLHKDMAPNNVTAYVLELEIIDRIEPGTKSPEMD
jgi:hypothetical protein